MDAHLAIEGLFAVAASLSALWIRAMREDIRAVREDVARVTAIVGDHGERIAVLESQMKRLDK